MGLATSEGQKHAPNAASVPSKRYVRRFGRKRFAIRNAASICFFAIEVAKFVLAFIVTRDRLSATKTEDRFAFAAIEGSFAIEAEYLFTLVTVERIFAVVAEWLVAMATDEHILAVETK